MQTTGPAGAQQTGGGTALIVLKPRRLAAGARALLKKFRPALGRLPWAATLAPASGGVVFFCGVAGRGSFFRPPTRVTETERSSRNCWNDGPLHICLLHS